MAIHTTGKPHKVIWHIWCIILVATWLLSTRARAYSQSNPMYLASVFSFLRSFVEKGIPVALNVEISSISLDMWVIHTCNLQSYFVHLVPYVYKFDDEIANRHGSYIKRGDGANSLMRHWYPFVSLQKWRGAWTLHCYVYKRKQLIDQPC